MLKLFRFVTYTITLLSLVTLDYYLLGNGFVDMCKRMLCKFTCLVRRYLREEERFAQIKEDVQISLTVLLWEIVFLGLTILFLNKYKKIRCKDKIDDLLQDSRDTLMQTNEFIEKWRLRRINMLSTVGDTYLDEEPQEILPCKIEVPILHMAIIDTLGTRNQPGSGDTGDVTKHLESALISMTSLDDDIESVSDEVLGEKLKDGTANTNRTLWDVTEKDASNLGG
ncbi:uncharacterized protein LOC112057865 [Bicyclus anynana]|uniref:Uncharacterized protein LOC112057865 n=1 Tax=Bicyclus anynana TaxID=110368 RepID=A0ABM3LYT6_BICAN|nr:uncharacterized protein LOC112057865 [Bicyclus anynana]